MPNEPQRCGTCRWWELRDTRSQLGWCRNPSHTAVMPMKAEDGEDLPCWARKESDDAE